jgi:hypothetical protein
MLCGGTSFFAPDREVASRVDIQLHVGGHEIAGMALSPIEMGRCSSAGDRYTDRIDIPEPDEPADVPDLPSDIPVDLPDEPEEVGGAELYLVPAPQVGALVLVRRIAVNLERSEHNPSHIIPAICCDEQDCGLYDLPEDPAPDQDPAAPI